MARCALSPLCRTLYELVQRILRCCSSSRVRVQTLDDASGNHRYHAWDQAAAGDSEMSGRILCCNHQSQLAHVNMVCACLGVEFMATLLSVVVYIKLGQHLLRLALCVNTYVANKVDVREGHPSDADAAFLRELMSYMRAMRRQEERHHAEAKRPSKQSGFFKRLETYYTYHNGGFFEANDLIVIYIAPLRHRGASAGDVVEVVSLALLDALFFSGLSTPSTGKWTTLETP